MWSPRWPPVYLLGSIVAFLGASCGEEPARPNGGVAISVTLPEEGWATRIEYRDTGADEHPSLTVDGVRFELVDPGACRIDWGALGVPGVVTATSYSYESTEPLAGSFLEVAGKPVELRAGELLWGGVSLGRVESGDRVRVDASGPKLP